MADRVLLSLVAGVVIVCICSAEPHTSSETLKHLSESTTMSAIPTPDNTQNVSQSTLVPENKTQLENATFPDGMNETKGGSNSTMVNNTASTVMAVTSVTHGNLSPETSTTKVNTTTAKSTVTATPSKASKTTPMFTSTVSRTTQRVTTASVSSLPTVALTSPITTNKPSQPTTLQKAKKILIKSKPGTPVMTPKASGHAAGVVLSIVLAFTFAVLIIVIIRRRLTIRRQFQHQRLEDMEEDL
uniref:uncharacterized protein n=1 Tax=Myxine glutinosa TaxID=7769 RepID=UPI00358F75E7